MSASLYWSDGYIDKKCTVKQAIEKIKPGNRVFIGSACGEPQKLIKELITKAVNLNGVEIIRMMSSKITSFADIADKTQDHSINIRNIYSGSTNTNIASKHIRFTTPLNISEIPGLFLSKKLPIDVALIQLSPPDDFGWMSLGNSVDITLAAAQSANIVVAQINSMVPRTMGQSFIHVNEIDCIVEHDEPLLTMQFEKESEVSTRIGKHIASVIDDGSTLQLGLGTAYNSIFKALLKKNNLGLHSQYITDDIMHLYSAGIINNTQKGFLKGKLVASCAVGSDSLYEFINDNPAIEFRPSDFVNDPFVISRNNKMVSVNVAQTVDLTGQVSVEASHQTLLTGISDISDFVRGAKRSIGGKSIIIFQSTSKNKKISNIVSSLNSSTIVPMNDAHYMITEYGVVNLFGKSLQERALAMISIAHPNFRNELLEFAKKAKLVSSDRVLGDATRGIYPVHLEETIIINGENINIRPAKPVDERRMQEHYYKLSKKDRRLRFLYDKSSFNRRDVETRLHIDYIRDLTLVAIVGEFGFGKIIGSAEYLLMQDSNLAEIAFSISKKYQSKGLGKIFLQKLTREAMNNGIDGLIACTSVENKAMIALFKTLPYKIKTILSNGTLTLKCRFNQTP